MSTQNLLFHIFLTAGQTADSIHDIAIGSMVALWPPDDSDNNGQSFLIADVIESNVFADTVTVVCWWPDEEEPMIYKREHANEGVITIAFADIFLHRFTLTVSNMLRETTKANINMLCQL